MRPGALRSAFVTNSNHILVNYQVTFATKKKDINFLENLQINFVNIFRNLFGDFLKN